MYVHDVELSCVELYVYVHDSYRPRVLTRQERDFFMLRLYDSVLPYIVLLMTSIEQFSTTI